MYIVTFLQNGKSILKFVIQKLIFFFNILFGKEVYSSFLAIHSLYCVIFCRSS